MTDRPEPSSRSALEADLRGGIKKHRTYSMIKRIVASLLLLGAITCGGLVVTNIGTQWFQANQLSAITAFGSVLLAVLRMGRLQEQAKWNKLKQRELEGLLRRLAHEGAEEREVSAELTKVLLRMEELRVWLEIPGSLSDLEASRPAKKP